MRPPLSKGLLKGETAAADLTFRTEDFFRDSNVRLVCNEQAAAIHTAAKAVELGSGERMEFDKLVLATGARARRLNCDGARLGNILELRTLDDAFAIADVLSEAKNICVVGGGFIGLEFAAVAAKAGKTVTVLEAGDRLMARALSTQMSGWFLDLHQRNGVDVRLKQSVIAFEGTEGKVRSIELLGGTSIAADLVVVGVGVVANQELAEAGGLRVNDGILVDAHLQTSCQNVFAIGDCARFPTPFSSAPVRLESVQNAVDQAKYLANSFAGKEGGYRAVPWFWSEQYDTKLQIAGLLSGYDESRVIGDPRTAPFSIEHYTAGRLTAVESINDVRTHLGARKALSSAVSATAD
jgi:3-phenylpropionate/trans-cinnamate dioxygenase ferredoxin reductase subunit